MAKLFDSLAGQTRFVLRTFVQYLVAFCSRPEASGDVLSGRFGRLIVHDKSVKSSDPCSNHSLEKFHLKPL